jgi:RimJ/RimL family protein N-acetyltransferase
MSSAQEKKQANLQLRPATLDDAALLLSWRNEPLSRQASHSTAEIQFDTHYRWLAETLASVHRKLYIAESDGTPLGSVRADYVNDTWKLSWVVSAEQRGRGVARRMVSLLVEGLSGCVCAEVREGNHASSRVAEHAGLRLVKRERGVLYYERSLPAQG